MWNLKNKTNNNNNKKNKLIDTENRLTDWWLLEGRGEVGVSKMGEEVKRYKVSAIK